MALQSVTPEEMIAQCAPDGPRTWLSTVRADAEFAKFGEAAGLLASSNKSGKYERQGDLNELIDTGRVSKLYRDGRPTP